MFELASRFKYYVVVELPCSIRFGGNVPFSSFIN